MFVFRALNEFDIACNPLINGIPSKKLVYDLCRSYILENEKEMVKGLNTSQLDNYIKQNMVKYLETHNYKLNKMFKRRSIYIENKLKGFKPLDIRFNQEKYGEYFLNFKKSLYYMCYYLSSLNNHLINGSKTYTDWISTSKNINSISKYYLNQDIHKLAVIRFSNDNLLSDNSLVIDLSSRELIDEVSFLLSKNIFSYDFNKFVDNDCFPYFSIFDEDFFDVTSPKFMGYNFSIHDNEVCVYRYIKPLNVLAVLDSLQIDLLSVKNFNLIDYCLLDKKKQIMELEKLKYQLKNKVLECNDLFLNYLFDELYEKNLDINNLFNTEDERQKARRDRIKILKLAKDIPNIQIKR